MGYKGPDRKGNRLVLQEILGKGSWESFARARQLAELTIKVKGMHALVDANILISQSLFRHLLAKTWLSPLSTLSTKVAVQPCPV